jgi:hypothetical protein
MKGLSSSLWFELILKPHLSIESGVALVSTCSFFWKSERIQKWLREKEVQVFGPNISKLFWNKLEFKPHLMMLDNAFDTLNTRFSLQQIYVESPKTDPVYRFGVFSSKERLWNAFNKLVNLNLNNEQQRSFSVTPHYFGVLIENDTGSRELLRASNIILEDFKLMILKPISQ